ncbi:MAG: alpha/beta fold hydrolase, partial [Persicimonas sp.]
MPKAKTKDGLDISYRVIGQGARDLVFVHGWMVSGAVWDTLLEALDPSQWRIIVPDMRGTGETAAQADSFELADYVEDVRAVVDHAGVDSFGLVGHSMGGQVAQLFAATYPERVERLALLCSVPASGMELPEEADALFFNSGEDRESQAAILGMACLDLEPADQARLLDDAGQIPAGCIQKSYRAWTGGGFADRLGDITAPTLVVGSDDPFLPPDFLNAAIVEPITNAEFAHI